MDDRQAYQIKIVLFRSDPLVWRTLAIPKDATLDELHECIQVLFGWKNIHDYYFEQIKLQKKYVRFPEEWDDEDHALLEPSLEVSLDECFAVGDHWKYVYDMENDWCHDLWIVKEVTLKNSGEPRLVEWAEDNLAEDSEYGVAGFYEKQGISEQPNHPRYQEMRDWMQDNHQPFEPDAVQHKLMALRYERISIPPSVIMADCCESLFTLTGEQALIRVFYQNEYYYLFLVNREDEERNIQIFRSRKDFNDSYFASYEHTTIHALYQNGYVLHFPSEMEFGLDEIPLEMLEPQMVRYERGKGEFEISYEEFEELYSLLKFLAFMEPYWEEHIGYLPDLQEGLLMNVIREGNQVHSDLRLYEPSLRKSRVQLGKRAMKALAQAKRSQEHLIMNLLAIPDLINDDAEYTFYIAASGKKTGFLHLLHTNEVNGVMMEIRDDLVKYMIDYGIPQEIDVEDRHLYMMLTQVCKDLDVAINWKSSDQDILSEQFDEAIREQNPLSALDQELLESLMHLSEAELMDYIEEQSDEKVKKILKQLVYMNLFHK